MDVELPLGVSFVVGGGVVEAHHVGSTVLGTGKELGVETDLGLDTGGEVAFGLGREIAEGCDCVAWEDEGFVGPTGPVRDNDDEVVGGKDESFLALEFFESVREQHGLVMAVEVLLL